MSGFLIDTNVLSEYNRPGGPDAGVRRWLETTARQCQPAGVITLAEIQKGLELPADRQAARSTGPVAEARLGSVVLRPVAKGRRFPALAVTLPFTWQAVLDQESRLGSRVGAADVAARSCALRTMSRGRSRPVADVPPRDGWRRR